jgi:hypothetical protein
MQRGCWQITGTHADPWASIGAAWVDLLVLCQASPARVAPNPRRCLNGMRSRGVDPDAMTAVLAGLAGYLMRESRQPPPPGLPTPARLPAQLQPAGPGLAPPAHRLALTHQHASLSTTRILRPAGRRVGQTRGGIRPRPSDYESDAPRRSGRLQTDRACSRWMPRRSRQLPRATERSSG